MEVYFQRWLFRFHLYNFRLQKKQIKALNKCSLFANNYLFYPIAKHRAFLTTLSHLFSKCTVIKNVAFLPYGAKTVTELQFPSSLSPTSCDITELPRFCSGTSEPGACGFGSAMVPPRVTEDRNRPPQNPPRVPHGPCPVTRTPPPPRRANRCGLQGPSQTRNLLDHKPQPPPPRETQSAHCVERSGLSTCRPATELQSCDPGGPHATPGRVFATQTLST